MTKFVDSHRAGVHSGRSKCGVACVRYLSTWPFVLEDDQREFFRDGGPGFVYWWGRNAHFIGIEAVHLECTVVDGGGPRSNDRIGRPSQPMMGPPPCFSIILNV